MKFILLIISLLFIIVLIPIIVTIGIIIIKSKKVITKNNISNNISSNYSKASFKVTNHNEETITNINGSKEDIIGKLSDDMKEKLSHGDVKITDSSIKKTTTYRNGEKVTEEEIKSTNQIDKKAIRKCPNCGVSIDSNLDKCTYCGTIIN